MTWICPHEFPYVWRFARLSFDFQMKIMIFVVLSWLPLCPFSHSGDNNDPLLIPSFLCASRFHL
jgi:hypothetical protein